MALPKQFKNRLYEVIFESDTRAGRIFDEILLVTILLSVIVVMLESISGIRLSYGSYLRAIEWGLTIIFTIEYLLRVYVSPRKRVYIFSFYGVIDLLAIIPTYLLLLLPGTQYLVIIRIIRLMRIFRIMKLVRYTRALRFMLLSLRASRFKIGIFMLLLLLIVTIMGSIMYLIEGGQNGFDSIPRSIYWAIITLTTVGYGDIVPQTVAGQALASFIMMLGYSIIAVPTGIISIEMSRIKLIENTQVCHNCGLDYHDDDAVYCKRCGAKMN